jgi:spore protease
MGYRTDLAVDRMDVMKESIPSGVKQTQQTKNTMTVTTIDIETQDAANAFQKPIGRYITIEANGFWKVSGCFEEEVETVSGALDSICPANRGCVLVVGLGNSQITPDALGPQVINYTLVTRHISKELTGQIGLPNLTPVSAIAPGVLGQTGMETAEIIVSLCRQIHPDFVIAVDALASGSLKRLGTTIQISNTGIAPGSGVLNHRKQLNEATLGIPVISMGVPTVVDLSAIISDALDENPSAFQIEQNMMVTPREIDNLIEHAAKTVAYAINRTLQPNLSLEEIAALTA